MKAYYDRSKEEFEFSSTNVKGMLKELKIFSNTVIVAVNGEVVNENYEFKEKDKIKILSVVSGG